MSIGDGPVFIGGPHRSGTGMLRAVIGSNSEVAIPPKEYQFFDVLGPAAHIDASDPSHLLRQILRWPKVMKWGVDEEQARTFASAGSNALKAIYSAPLLAYASRMDKPRFGEKTPYLERHFEVLLNWFGPSLRFFHIIRDPFHTFLSLIHCAECRNCPAPRQFSEQWHTSLLAGLHYRDACARNYMLLKYEDFVEDPQYWTEVICEFGGLPREVPRMLAMDDFQRKQNSSFGASHGWNPRPGQVARPVEIGRPTLSSAMERIIGARVFPDAGRLGYLPRACPDCE